MSIDLEHIKKLLSDGNKMSISTCTFEAIIDELEDQIKLNEKYKTLLKDIRPCLDVIAHEKTCMFGKECPTQDAKLIQIVLNEMDKFNEQETTSDN